MSLAAQRIGHPNAAAEIVQDIGEITNFEDIEKELLTLPGVIDVVPMALGPRIMRADTAAIAALTVWQSVLGDWV